MLNDEQLQEIKNFTLISHNNIKDNDYLNGKAIREFAETVKTNYTALLSTIAKLQAQLESKEKEVIDERAQWYKWHLKCEELELERDALKARAAALELALKENYEPCKCCIYYFENKETHESCIKCIDSWKGFQLGKAKFTAAKKGEEQ